MDKDKLIDWVPEIREPGHEIFGPNSWYGGAAVLKKYSGWKLPLPMVIPHGVVFSTNFLWEAENESGLPAVHCFPEFRRNAYLASKKLRFILGASPWLYLLKMSSHASCKRRGTVAFPSHSTHHVSVKTDDKAYANYLKGLPKKFKPVRVCMYWRDLELGRHVPPVGKNYVGFGAVISVRTPPKRSGKRC